MGRFVDRDDDLHPDLRTWFMRRAQGMRPRLPGNVRQLGARGVVVPLPPAGSRGAVIKSWLAKPSTTGAHLRYLQHGKGLDGQEADLFTREGVSVDRRTFARDAADDPHQYRLIISLVDGDRMDLTAYTQRLMRQVERDLLGPVDWIGATHRDTSHVHTHLIIRGRDPAGNDLYIHPRYLRQGMRARARTLATDTLGPLPPAERQQDRQRTHEVAHVVNVHAREAKKEDGMEDPDRLERPDDPRTRDQVTFADGTQRTLSPVEYEEALRDEAAAPAEDRNRIIHVETLAPLTLSERIAALKEKAAQMSREKTQEQDHGMAL